MQDLYFPFSSLCLVISLLMQFSRCSAKKKDLLRDGGDKGSRTPDLLLARQALSQLSYAPIFVLQGAGTGPED